MPIQKPPSDGSSGGGDDKKSPLERYLAKQKQTRAPKPTPKPAAATNRLLHSRPQPEAEQPDLKKWEKIADERMAREAQPEPPVAAPQSADELRSLDHGAPVAP